MRKSNWIISPFLGGKIKKYVKPPPRSSFKVFCHAFHAYFLELPWILLQQHCSTEVNRSFKRRQDLNLRRVGFENPWPANLVNCLFFLFNCIVGCNFVGFAQVVNHLSVGRYQKTSCQINQLGIVGTAHEWVQLDWGIWLWAWKEVFPVSKECLPPHDNRNP